MKTILYKPGFCLIILLFAAPFYSFSQEQETDECLEPEYHEQCFNAVRSVFDDYMYLKSRPFSKEMDNVKFWVNLKKNTMYLFDICQGTSSNAVINIYDENENLIASTYDKNKSRFTRLLSFYTGASGKYSISVSFKHSQEKCVVVSFGMIRKNIETYMKIPSGGEEQ